MWQSIAGWLATGVGVYSVLGVVFAVPFVVRGVGKIDPVAQNGTWGFRILIFPGSVALWPILLRRWVRNSPMPVEQNSHRQCAQKNLEARS